MSFVTFGVFTVLIAVASSQCGPWTVTNPDDGSQVTLDLGPLNGVIMNLTDGEDHNITYSVCRNDELCNGEKAMVRQVPVDDPRYCFILGRWDYSINPEFENINGGTWTFVYDNGDDECGNPVRTWSPLYVCTPGVKYRAGNVTEIASCYYEVTIETEFACQNWTTTTTAIPTSQCIFKSQDGEHILNMTSIRGQLISGETDIHDMYIMYYPCMNLVKCNNNDVMAYLFDGENVLCKQYLAIWEDGFVEPNYIESLKMWQFTYTNGESCNGGQNVFNVEWVCDPLAPSPMVIQSMEIAPCVYQMIINSQLACE
eukprot:435948_1